jgi:hypothetical protein
MDHQLSLFVRKYCFDFAKASKALRSYVQHVLVEMDDVDVDSQVLLCIDRVCLQPCAPLSRALTGAGFHGGCMPQALGGARHGGV